MTNPKFRLRQSASPWLLVFAASAGLALGACEQNVMNEQDEDDPNTIYLTDDIVTACDVYCEKFGECNKETEVDECAEKCKGVLYACEVHKPGEAIDQVFQCAGKDCFAFPLCTTNAGVQCLTGLGF